jgi:transposase
MDVISPEPVDEAETARTSAPTSGRSGRVEVLTRAEPRRSWTVEQKREIVAESLGPDLTPTEVARKYRISSGQLYTWRQQMLSLQSVTVTRTPLRLAAVELTAPLSPTSPEPPSSEQAALSLPSRSSARPEGLIEILLPGGVSLRVDAQVDGRALRRVLGALESR